MKFKGTQGQWSYEAVSLSGSTKFEVRFGGDGECVSEIVHNEHDAKLIAAAPELLTALQGLMADVGGGKKNCEHQYSCVCAFDAAKEAINKALGQ